MGTEAGNRYWNGEGKGNEPLEGWEVNATIRA